MKRCLYCLIVCAIFPVAHLFAATETSESGSGSLKGLLAGEGFAGAALERRFGNHLLVSTVINGKHSALAVDTGAPLTLIDRSSVASLGLAVKKTNSRVGRAYGWTHDTFGVGHLSTLAMGNCTFVNVPVAVADASDMNIYGRVEHSDGLFGANEMIKFGCVIDCARQMLYVSPRGSSTAASQKLAAFLISRGFTQIPLRLDSSHHFAVEAAINGHPARLVVDTGAGTTHLAKDFAVQAGVVPAPIRARMDTGDGRSVRLNGGYVKELSIGNFKVLNAEVELSKLSDQLGAGLLGAEYLTFNFAVIDLGGMSLYLRHADPR
jgi:predicted aspartyl protease